MQAQLREDRADHWLDCLDAEMELSADGRVGQASRDEFEHLVLARSERGQTAPAIGLSGGGHLPGYTQVGDDESGLGDQIVEHPLFGDRQPAAGGTSDVECSDDASFVGHGGGEALGVQEQTIQ